jgi:hypothetical protein
MTPTTTATTMAMMRTVGGVCEAPGLSDRWYVVSRERRERERRGEKVE